MYDNILLENRYCAHNYAPLAIVLTRGDGVYLWDTEGNRYIDMMSAYSAVSHGHADSRLIETLYRQAKELSVVSRAFYTDRLGPFLERACQLTRMDKALPMNTGTEAVETALKAARKWGHKVKGIPENQAEIIVCDGNFHGRSISIVGFSSNQQYKSGFGPFPRGFIRIPFGDAEALERVITPNTAAFLVEPIQGEGGINVPPDGYLAECAALCRRHNVLLMCDEIQTGLGRTGALLACDHEGVRPDGLMLGKALGGGLLPVSLFLAREDVMEVFRPGDHGSTFGGNPLAASVGLEALNILVEDGLPERAARNGAYLKQSIKAIESTLIRDVRGKGLLVGVEFDETLASGQAVCEALAEHGVLTKETHGSVVRLAPPLIITRDQIDWAVDRFGQALSKLESDRYRKAFGH